MSLTFTAHVDTTGQYGPKGEPLAGIDVLVSLWDDGSAEVALRPGRDWTWVAWGPPAPLEDADVLHRVEGENATVPALLRYLEGVERGVKT